ncbi:MAG: helix-turn-helix transcriptional regulator [Bacteroidetes bacterium]|nr:helix-turn-helix transcriptional regulator [Bacteroidota bacterium]
MKSLTEAERKVLNLVSEGRSSIEIAAALNLSRHTIESRRKSLLIKFNARNSVELVKKAIAINAITII